MRRFTWDANKARSNLAGHKVGFETAVTVFADPNAQIRPDDEPTEERWRIIGLAERGVLFVVFTEPGDDVTHIISARRANRREQDRYYRQALP